MDDDGVEVVLDEPDAAALLALLGDLEAATVSACPECRARVLAAVALVDLLERSAPHPRAGELRDLADDAPTLHLFVVDGRAGAGTNAGATRWRTSGAMSWTRAGRRRGADDQPASASSAANAVRKSIMRPSMSSTAAGSTLIPMSSASAYPSVVTLIAVPALGPNG